MHLCMHSCSCLHCRIQGDQGESKVTFQREAFRYMPAAKALRKTLIYKVFFFSSLYFCCSFVCVCVFFLLFFFA